MALERFGRSFRLVDTYLSASKPWETDRKPRGRSETLREFFTTLQRRFASLSVLAHPVIPEATQRIWEQLGQARKLANVRIDELKWGGLKPGTQIGKPEAVFPRVDKKETIRKD